MDVFYRLIKTKFILHLIIFDYFGLQKFFLRSFLLFSNYYLFILIRLSKTTKN